MKQLNTNFLVSLVVVTAAVGFCGCSFSAEPRKPAQPRSYLELPGSRQVSAVPYVWERKGKTKHLIVIGSRHVRDPRSPLFDRIETIFNRIRPEVVIHENVAPEHLKTMPMDQAIKIGADLGFTVHLAERFNAQIRSGDAPEKDEFKALLAVYPAEDVFVFLTGQRLIGSVRNPDLKIAQAEYSNFYHGYLVKNGIPKREDWAQWNGFLKAYERVVGKPFTRESWHPVFVNPTVSATRLNQVARTSDVVRDRFLLASIRKALKDNDRVVVVFGAWHVLALEPVLNDLVLE